MVDVIADRKGKYEPSKEFEKKDFYMRIEKVLTQFSKIEGDIFRMWMSGFTYKEMGEKFSMDKRSIEYIVHKIRKQLRPILKDWGDF